MGVTECDNMLMLLGVSNKMSEKVRGLSAYVFTFGFCFWQNNCILTNCVNN